MALSDSCSQSQPYSAVALVKSSRRLVKAVRLALDTTDSLTVHAHVVGHSVLSAALIPERACPFWFGGGQMGLYGFALYITPEGHAVLPQPSGPFSSPSVNTTTFSTNGTYISIPYQSRASTAKYITSGSLTNHVHMSSPQTLTGKRRSQVVSIPNH